MLDKNTEKMQENIIFLKNKYGGVDVEKKIELFKQYSED
jgi:hypothetical protein